MRNILIAGSAGLLLALTGVGAANANNPNVPTWSPYSINTNLSRGTLFHRHVHGTAAARAADKMTEGRAAYVEKWPTPPDNATSSGGSPNAIGDGNSAAPVAQPSDAPEGVGSR